MKRVLSLGVFLVFLWGGFCYAGQSTITESEGYACMGEDRTKRQTEELALQDAKRQAIEQVSSYIKSETTVSEGKLQKDLLRAYTNASVRIIESEGRWDTEPPRVGDCYRVRIKAEVIPDEKAMKATSEAEDMDDPSAPLKVRIWTDKKQYLKGERVKIYLKGNKPFYARVIYRQADGTMVQILPNPYRRDNYFQGGVVYEIPSGPDRFDLEVTPPFGEEYLILYASTEPLGELELEQTGGVYAVKTALKDIGQMTRGIKITGRNETRTGEFVEEKLKIMTE
ncbi:MAG: DUF4384 domain-containing protein [Nitrospirae bacterium]|nr:MAG: DUF4384 domain-containing protein [Nitrospirota bacterium]